MIPLRDANPTRRTPVVTLTLIVACFAVFAYELGIYSSGGEDDLVRFFRDWGVVPADLTASIRAGNLATDPSVGLVSHLFLHGSWLHVLGNMLYLWIFGNNIEDRLGRLAFIGFYLVGGVAAGLAQVAIAPESEAPLVGASGAIAAILGAYLVLFPRARILSLVFLGFFYQLIEVPAVIVLGFWFILQLIDGFASLGLTESQQPGIAFFAHIGGFVAGVVIAAIVRARRRSPPAVVPAAPGPADRAGMG